MKVLRKTVLEQLKTRFLWYAVGVGLVVSYTCVSLDLTPKNLPVMADTIRESTNYSRAMLFQFVSLYWGFVAASLCGGVFSQEIDDGSIDLVLTSTRNRTQYAVERIFGMLTVMSLVVGFTALLTILLVWFTGGGELGPLFLLANIGLLPCFAIVITTCALLATKLREKNTGRVSFLVFTSIWFVNSGYLMKYFGLIGLLGSSMVPNVWQWQSQMGGLLIGKISLSGSIWPLINLCCYVASGLLLAVQHFCVQDL